MYIPAWLLVFVVLMIPGVLELLFTVFLYGVILAAFLAVPITMLVLMKGA